MNYRKKFIPFLLFQCIVIVTIGQTYFSKDYDFDSGDLDRISLSLMENDTLYFKTTEDCGSDFCARFVVMDSLGNIISEKLHSDIRMNARNGMIKEGNELIVLTQNCCNDSAYYRLVFLDHLSLEIKRSFNYYPEEEMIFVADAAVESFGNYYILMGWSQQSDDNWPEQMLWVNKQTMEVDTTITFSNPDAVGVWNNGHVNNGIFYAMYDLVDPVLNDVRGYRAWDTSMNEIYNYQITPPIIYNIWQNSSIVLTNGNIIFEILEDLKFLNISCVDSNNQILWENTEISSGDSSFGNKIWSFSETSAGDIIACGISRWFLGYEGALPSPLTPELIDSEYNAAYIVKLSGDTGEILWEYSLVEFEPDGEVRKTNLLGIHELSDGSIMGTGYVRQKDEDGLYNNYNSWVVRLPADGCRPEYDCVNESYTSKSIETVVWPENEKVYTIYPNPSEDGTFTFESISSPIKNSRLLVYNSQGTVINNTPINNSANFHLKIQDISGIYFYSIFREDGMVIQKGKLLSN